MIIEPYAMNKLSELKILAILRDKEANDEPLTLSERRTLKRILKARSYLNNVAREGFSKGWRD